MMLSLPQVEVKARPIDWQGMTTRFVNDGEIEIMVQMLRDIGARRMAEFGVNTGRTARLILDNVFTISEYIGVDVMPGYTPALPIQYNEVSLDPGRYVRHDPRFILRVLPNGTRDLTDTDLEPLDALFIDGDHSRAGVVHDTELAYATVRHGGLIFWHDYHDLGTVDVADVLHDLHASGRDIRHIAKTWLAFERVEQWVTS